MLTVTGFGVLLSAILGQVDSPLAFTLVLLFGELWIALYAALILSFVTGGRLTTRIDVVLVEAFVFGLFVMQFAVLLFLPDERNLLLVWPDAGIANALTKLQWAVLAVASLGVVVVTAHRWRVASRPRRRALLPSLGGSLSGVLYAANLTTLIAGSPSVLLMTALNAALLTVPAALLWGLLRSRLARSGLADLFRELGSLRGVRLEAGLAKVLGDPGLVLAYRVPGERSYMDGRGQPVALPAPGGDRAAAPVERDGRELAMLIYDASLDDDPELVGAVAAAAAIALDDARLQAESEDRLAELRASRERIVAAGDAERRRLERNLHDGAQQRLVSVALQLRMIQRRIRDRPRAGEAAGDVGQRGALEVARGVAGARARDPSLGAQPRSEGRARLAGVALGRTDHGVLPGPGAPARAGGARRLLRRLRGAGQRRQVRPGDQGVGTGLAPQRRGGRSRSPTTASAAPTRRPAPGSKGWPTGSPHSTARCASSALRGRGPWSRRSCRARRDRRRQPAAARGHRVVRARRGHRSRRGGVERRRAARGGRRARARRGHRGHPHAADPDRRGHPGRARDPPPPSRHGRRAALPARGGRRRHPAAGRGAAAPRLPAQGPRDRPGRLRRLAATRGRRRHRPRSRRSCPGC